ncbi:MAG: hypothetical protein QM831_20770 [Kofleriaceae bacterium]
MARQLLLQANMTRQFHHPIRVVTRKLRDPNPNTLSFTCFRLVRNYDDGSPPYTPVQLIDATNAMRALVIKR